MIISVLVLSLLVIRLGFEIAYTIKPELGYRYIEDPAPKVKSIQSFGADRQYVSIGLDRNYITGNVGMTQNYFVTASYKYRVDAKANELKIDKGESLIITTYDLNTSNFKKKTFDLLPILLKDGINHQIIELAPITYKGKDYLKLTYYTTNFKAATIWYDMESERVESAKSRDYQIVYGGFGKEYDNFDFPSRIRSDYGMFIGKLNLNSAYQKAKNLEDTNLALELPKVAENLSNGEILFARPAQVSPEEWFNTVLHWLAPKGQEIMEVYAKDIKTGEKTQIKSYADFEEWKKVHPSDQ